MRNLGGLARETCFQAVSRSVSSGIQQHLFGTVEGFVTIAIVRRGSGCGCASTLDIGRRYLPQPSFLPEDQASSFTTLVGTPVASQLLQMYSSFQAAHAGS